MKIRVQGNSIRLRLSQSDVKDFAQSGQLKEKIQFPGERVLHYELLRSSLPEIGATFDNSTISIQVPDKLATTWITSEQVGFEGKVLVNDQLVLAILVEKDFQCLHPRQDQDESDSFPHPKAD